MQRARARWSVNAVVSAGVATFGASTIAASALPSLLLLAPAILIAGAAWVSFLSLFNVQMLSQAPDWVRARVLAISLLVSQGAVAAGSATWGAVAGRAGISEALLWIGIGAILAASLGLFLRMPDASVDLTPWNHWRMPAVTDQDAISGPVLVTVEYHVDPVKAPEFLQVMHQYGRIRRRDGASRWGIARDLELRDRYVETFIVSSWAEHVRQHDRLTRADSDLEEKLHNCVLEKPKVRHLVFL